MSALDRRRRMREWAKRRQEGCTLESQQTGSLDPNKVKEQLSTDPMPRQQASSSNDSPVPGAAVVVSPEVEAEEKQTPQESSSPPLRETQPQQREESKSDEEAVSSGNQSESPVVALEPSGSSNQSRPRIVADPEAVAGIPSAVTPLPEPPSVPRPETPKTSGTRGASPQTSEDEDERAPAAVAPLEEALVMVSSPLFNSQRTVVPANLNLIERSAMTTASAGVGLYRRRAIRERLRHTRGDVPAATAFPEATPVDSSVNCVDSVGETPPPPPPVSPSSEDDDEDGDDDPGDARNQTDATGSLPAFPAPVAAVPPPTIPAGPIRAAPIGMPPRRISQADEHPPRVAQSHKPPMPPPTFPGGIASHPMVATVMDASTGLPGCQECQAQPAGLCCSQCVACLCAPCHKRSHKNKVMKSHKTMALTRNLSGRCAICNKTRPGWTLCLNCAAVLCPGCSETVHRGRVADSHRRLLLPAAVPPPPPHPEPPASASEFLEGCAVGPPSIAAAPETPVHKSSAIIPVSSSSSSSPSPGSSLPSAGALPQPPPTVSSGTPAPPVRPTAAGAPETTGSGSAASVAAAGSAATNDDWIGRMQRKSRAGAQSRTLDRGPAPPTTGASCSGGTVRGSSSSSSNGSGGNWFSRALGIGKPPAQTPSKGHNTLDSSNLPRQVREREIFENYGLMNQYRLKESGSVSASGGSGGVDELNRLRRHSLSVMLDEPAGGDNGDSGAGSTRPGAGRRGHGPQPPMASSGFAAGPRSPSSAFQQQQARLRAASSAGSRTLGSSSGGGGLASSRSTMQLSQIRSAGGFGGSSAGTGGGGGSNLTASGGRPSLSGSPEGPEPRSFLEAENDSQGGASGAGGATQDAKVLSEEPWLDLDDFLRELEAGSSEDELPSGNRQLQRSASSMKKSSSSGGASGSKSKKKGSRSESGLQLSGSAGAAEQQQPESYRRDFSGEQYPYTVMEGYLNKRLRHNRHQWHKRYFKLARLSETHTQLSYYGDASSSHNLELAKHVFAQSDIKRSRRRRKGHGASSGCRFVIEMADSQNDFELQADTQAACDNWVHWLSELCERRPEIKIDEEGIIEFMNPALWKPLKDVSRCMHCEETFRIGRSKQNCRICGDVFCKSCTPFEISRVRVCIECWERIPSFVKPQTDGGFGGGGNNPAMLPSPSNAAQSPQSVTLESLEVAPADNVQWSPVAGAGAPQQQQQQLQQVGQQRQSSLPLSEAERAEMHRLSNRMS